MKRYNVTFLPDGKKIEVDEGITLLDAAAKAGVYLNSLCGGEGVCGKCRVQIAAGQAKVDPQFLVFFSKDEIQKGYVLACQTQVNDNLEVLVPPSHGSRKSRYFQNRTCKSNRAGEKHQPSFTANPNGYLCLRDPVTRYPYSSRWSAKYTWNFPNQPKKTISPIPAEFSENSAKNLPILPTK